MQKSNIQTTCPCGCGQVFEPTVNGGHVQKFASKPCKTKFESIARAYGMMMIETGLQTCAGMQAAIDAHNSRNSSRATATDANRPLEAAE